MSAKVLFPSLDTDGWLSTSVKVADSLISHFFLSEYSQTAVFPGTVASFAWILQQYQNDLSRTVQETQGTLSSYFSKYFQNVEVEVKESLMENSINRYQLTIYLVFTDEEGVQHNLSRLIRYTGMKVTEIIAVLNNG